MDKYEEFVRYFEELDRLGIPWGQSDLLRKAEELGLPVPGSVEWDEMFK